MARNVGPTVLLLAGVVAALIAAGVYVGRDIAVRAPPSPGIDAPPNTPADPDRGAVAELPRETPPETFPVAGRVFTSGRRGVADAIVDVGRARATTDALGRFTLDAVPSGEQTVVVWAAEHDLYTRSHHVPGGPLDVRLTPLQTIAGVARLPDGAAIPNARIYIWRKNEHDDGEYLTTDDEGRFRLERQRPGRYYVRLEPAFVDGRPWATAYGVREGGNRGDFLVRAAPGHVIRGIVYAPDGSVVADAHVVATSVASRSPRSAGNGTTDAEGRFEIIVREDTKHSVLVETPTAGVSGFRYLPWTRHVAPESPELDVRLVRGHTVRATITAPRGVSVAGRRVLVFRTNIFPYKHWTTATIGVDGALLVEGLWGQRYELRLDPAQPQNEGWMLDRTAPVRAGSDPVTIAVARALEMRGRVVGADGIPIAGLPLRLRLGPVGRTFLTETDDDGRFHDRRLVPGLYSIAARFPGPITSRSWKHIGKAEAGDTEVEIRLTK